MRIREKIKATFLKLRNRLEGENSTAQTLDEFWANFRLSPFQFEHTILTSTKWLVLIVFGPLGLLALIGFVQGLLIEDSASWSRVHRITYNTFYYLRDKLLSPVSLSLFFFAVTYRFFWYPSISKAFRSLLEDNLLTNGRENFTPSSFLEFLEEYRRDLHSYKRYVWIIVSSTVLVGILLFMSITGGMWDNRNDNALIQFLHILEAFSYWVVPIIVWTYIVILWFWTLQATIKAVINLTPRFQISVHPFHSDKVGGLKKNRGSLHSHWPTGYCCRYAFYNSCSSIYDSIHKI